MWFLKYSGGCLDVLVVSRVLLGIFCSIVGVAIWLLCFLESCYVIDNVFFAVSKWLLGCLPGKYS